MEERRVRIYSYLTSRKQEGKDKGAKGFHATAMALVHRTGLEAREMGYTHRFKRTNIPDWLFPFSKYPQAS